MVCRKWNDFITSEQFCKYYFSNIVCHVENLSEEFPLLSLDRIGCDLDNYQRVDLSAGSPMPLGEIFNILEDSSAVKKLSLLGYSWKEHFYWKVLSLIASLKKIGLKDLDETMKLTIGALLDDEKEKLKLVLKEWRLQNVFRVGFCFLCTHRFLVCMRDNGEFYGVITNVFLTHATFSNMEIQNEKLLSDFLQITGSPNCNGLITQPVKLFNDLHMALIPESRKDKASYLMRTHFIRAPFLVFTEEYTEEKRKINPTWDIDYSEISAAWEKLSTQQLQYYEEQSQQDRLRYQAAIDNFVYRLPLE
ncbi:predicted protein [Naegleria gruberi]|uniref:Predicted protein n=1 Tax=Naegleria gruberi TaxID=5762 RepID=D2VPB8_NAEGR|nr:uncharacterized protein NAEGRDRAFT_70799 [Naegleria gruberi]EFC41407.1 predicted protein [Naegleria gruberi]|eukprot:XP_002674151.1 predicted protein [Naegleria gruberi strain NEG-M]